MQSKKYIASIEWTNENQVKIFSDRAEKEFKKLESEIVRLDNMTDKLEIKEHLTWLFKDVGTILFNLAEKLLISIK